MFQVSAAIAAKEKRASFRQQCRAAKQTCSGEEQGFTGFLFLHAQSREMSTSFWQDITKSEHKRVCIIYMHTFELQQV